jgi:hypothetical protein
MGNLNTHNFNKIDVYLNNSEYYDFFLVNGHDENYFDNKEEGSCLVVHYDFNENNIYPNLSATTKTIYSLVTWDGAINTGYTLPYFGLTGLDNGFIIFNKLSADTSNQALLSAMTGTVITIPSGDTRLFLTQVTGMTNNYLYPISIETDPTVGLFSRFYGGFYQGFFKLDGYTYEVLPTRFSKAWASEFWLRKSDVIFSGNNISSFSLVKNNASRSVSITPTSLFTDTSIGQMPLSVDVSIDGGNSFTNLLELNNNGYTTNDVTIALSSFLGSQFYWLDDSINTGFINYSENPLVYTNVVLNYNDASSLITSLGFFGDIGLSGFQYNQGFEIFNNETQVWGIINNLSSFLLNNSNDWLNLLNITTNQIWSFIESGDTVTFLNTGNTRYTKIRRIAFNSDNEIILSNNNIVPVLNDNNPNNKGFFFYIGTRAENKYWNIFEGNNTGCTINCESDSGCTDSVTNFCTIPKETEISISGDSGYPIKLSPPPLEITEITNPFLIYGRASGNSTCGRCGAPSGLGNKTVCNYDNEGEELLELDKDIDIYDNALGLRIRDNGSIGYRALRFTGYCSGDTYVTGITVEEKYSDGGVIEDDKWHNVVVKYVMPNEYDESDLKHGKPRKGRLMFYVDCKLRFVAEDVDEFIFRRLNEYKDKQLGVPYNISLGGGTQGLLESMTFDGQDTDDIGLEIEKNFAGTFIGDISQFKFYICNLSWCEIKDSCKNENKRYGN